jgi:GrpB-like predicted nucleotidyltransferase (UPF0157 family)
MLDATQDDHVVVVNYDPTWPAAYERERAALCRALGAVITDIQHIGSTAIPGLQAKPVIDILAAVRRFEPVEVYAACLEPLGYRHMSHPNEAERIFFRKGAPRTHHLHIIEDGSWEHRRLILFRNYLLKHPQTTEAYEALKRDLAARFGNNRPLYTESKTTFILDTIRQADAENQAQEGGRLLRTPC